jgi:hypothetical protein
MKDSILLRISTIFSILLFNLIHLNFLLLKSINTSLGIHCIFVLNQTDIISTPLVRIIGVLNIILITSPSSIRIYLILSKLLFFSLNKILFITLLNNLFLTYFLCINLQ